MPSTIAVSTRLSSAKGYEEKRDSISRDWIKLFAKLSLKSWRLNPILLKEKIVNNKAAGIPKVIRYVGAGFFGILIITN